jgi:hypothetical protein
LERLLPLPVLNQIILPITTNYLLEHLRKTSKHVEALQKSCDYHLKVIPTDAPDAANKKYMAHIHWPVARKQRGRLISATEAKQFDEVAGYTVTFLDDRNKAGEEYVQAPVCPQVEVKAEIQSMEPLNKKETKETDGLPVASRRQSHRQSWEPIPLNNEPKEKGGPPVSSGLEWELDYFGIFSRCADRMVLAI